MIGGQTKTPTISVRYLDSKSYVGGAGVVALHLRSAGAKVTFTTLLGQDSPAQMVYKDLQSSGITINRISDNQRPTTQKNVIICNGYRLLKLDTLDNTPVSTAISNDFMKSISSTDSDIVVFSDFRHGIFHKQNIPDLTSAIDRNVFKVADSQVASRWGNVSDFIGFDLITPNEREARFSLADQDSTIGPLAGNLYRLAKCKNLILKLGEKGLIGLSSSEIEDDPIMISLDSFTENPIDPVGAGDALMAYAALTLKVTGSLPMASIIGSIAAACESDLDGNIPIKRSQIIEKLDSLKKSMGYEVQ
jgi:bifunctional ADP-heptose synthase (sugar kinase/adenylyltransferase)